jgi:hypothetical protein
MAPPVYDLGWVEASRMLKNSLFGRLLKRAQIQGGSRRGE